MLDCLFLNWGAGALGLGVQAELVEGVGPGAAGVLELAAHLRRNLAPLGGAAQAPGQLLHQSQVAPCVRAWGEKAVVAVV